jgi:xanthine dehydrogenase iron-sulfur cluster and FAD-binding subunit A
MGNLENIFDKRLKQLGIKNKVEASLIVEEAQKEIERVFKQRGVENLKAISFKKGVLKIGATNNLWAAECQGKLSEIKKPPVERVVFEIRNFDY